MQIIKDNPDLMLSSVKDLVKSPDGTLTVPPCSEFIARELFQHFIQHVCKFKIDGKELTVKEALERKLFDFKVNVEPKLKEKEWILITKDNIYYSRGDNSA